MYPREGANEFIQRIRNCLTLTFTTEFPFLKTLALYELSRELCANSKHVQYVDLDLQFTSLVANIRDKPECLSFLGINSPRTEHVFDTMIHILSRLDLGYGGALVIDSVNTLAELMSPRQGDNADHVGANQRVAVILTLFEELARRNSKLLFLSNIARSRPHPRGAEISWEKEPPGGRMIRMKSDIMISISESVDRASRKNGSSEAKIVFEVLSVASGIRCDLTVGEKIELISEPFFT